MHVDDSERTNERMRERTNLSERQTARIAQLLKPFLRHEHILPSALPRVHDAQQETQGLTATLYYPRHPRHRHSTHNTPQKKKTNKHMKANVTPK